MDRKSLATRFKRRSLGARSAYDERERLLSMRIALVTRRVEAGRSETAPAAPDFGDWVCDQIPEVERAGLCSGCRDNTTAANSTPSAYVRFSEKSVCAVEGFWENGRR
jgi:hypothetical protein